MASGRTTDGAADQIMSSGARRPGGNRGPGVTEGAAYSSLDDQAAERGSSTSRAIRLMPRLATYARAVGVPPREPIRRAERYTDDDGHRPVEADCVPPRH